MVKESLSGIDKRLIFRETFNDEASVRANGGTPTAVTFSNGVGSFNGTTSFISYPRRFKNEIYSIRIRFTRIGSLQTKYLFDCDNRTVSFIHLNSSGHVNTPGTRYVDGVAISTYTVNTKEIVVTGLTLNSLANFRIGASTDSTAFVVDADFELFEIYKGTLTADEVKNFDENKAFKELTLSSSGSNIATNGGFENLDSGTPVFENWSDSSAGSSTVTASEDSYEGSYACALNVDASGNFALVIRTLLTVGKRYRAIFHAKVSSTTGYNGLRVGAETNVIIINSTTYQQYITEFTATHTSFQFNRDGSSVQNKTFFIDNVTVTEIPPQEILRVDARNGVISNKYSEMLSFNDLATPLSGWTKSGTVANDGDGVQFEPSTTNYVYRGSGAISRTFKVTIKASSTVAGDVIRFYQGQTTNAISCVLTTTPTVYTGLVTNNLSATIYVQGLSGSGLVSVSLLEIKEVIPTVVNTATTVVRSGNVSAMDFNGTTSKLDLGSYDTLVGDKTFIAWIKPRRSPVGNDYYRMFNNGKFEVYYYDSDTSVAIARDGATFGFSATNSHRKEVYSLVVITSTSTGVTNFYTNGVLNGTANQSAGTPVAGTSMIVGTNNTRWFTGPMSNLRIINGILSAQEITQIWQNEKGYYNL